MPMFFHTFTATAPFGDGGVDGGVGTLRPAGLAEAPHRESGGEMKLLRILGPVPIAASACNGSGGKSG